MNEVPFTLFAKHHNGTVRVDFSLWKVLTLRHHEMTQFWEMWLGITAWMAVSYITIHLTAALVAMIMLRKHSWMVMIVLPMIAVAFIYPATIGALTSASIALTFSSADKAINSTACMILGCSQTLFIVVLSFSRILATL
ncbi:hypothetical protein AB6A40_009735 [Gnathostoma spinigerum]|uniref:Transmembrane protein 170A n=1 Tax=Gnathostoma spinigerum TaxID=75299 RepID=A0ABD6EUL3_9BILA